MQLSAAAMRKRISRANKTEEEMKAVKMKKLKRKSKDRNYYKRKGSYTERNIVRREVKLLPARFCWREKYCKERSETTKLFDFLLKKI